jgi:hypothetical protein
MFSLKDMAAVVILKPPNVNRTSVFLMPQGFYVGCQVPIDACIVGNKDSALCTLKYCLGKAYLIRVKFL